MPLCSNRSGQGRVTLDHIDSVACFQGAPEELFQGDRVTTWVVISVTDCPTLWLHSGITRYCVTHSVLFHLVLTRALRGRYFLFYRWEHGALEKYGHKRGVKFRSDQSGGLFLAIVLPSLGDRVSRRTYLLVSEALKLCHTISLS